ncbi:hypothetical protein ASPACDRAFT_54669 [Aspergillus aculeatus ATCC 16872]|uniref:Carboxylic ester hydrolase n=1 Tax=Aspergillus aculeatus (strain ATCC 16872 / CBS 172.66 / WB 5094) TaxID=690307 RepID=A0A1L9WJJ6_ASPA1|nr:uncharacterized protein ASPACDRAFT_54669 [Aspergillus aculeatus ATCC 16872]OJJ96317.1 hypothetical protein ASPACDRAFT_54669 [Aspergillus aculeatus ATCC 16872]
MKPSLGLLASATGLTLARAASMADVCTSDYARSALPSTDLGHGIVLKPSTVVATAVYNASSAGSDYFPAMQFDYCNVWLQLWLPSPDKYRNRWVSTGGFAFSINYGTSLLPGGVIYGAAAGITDGGFGGFSEGLNSVEPVANGTLDRNPIYMLGYQGHHEMSLIGKAFTQRFFNATDRKLYSYYQGCSEGGREGWSQVQRFPDEWDGAVIGAPAIRFGQQQVNHLFPNVAEQTMGYYPPPCELEKIMNLTIAACDGLDGKADGVVSRTDLCKLHFDLNSTLGTPYNCPASSTTTTLKKRLLSQSYTTPAQNGTISANGVALASTLYNGLHTLDGKRAHIWYQLTSGEWELDITALGGEYVARFLQYQQLSKLPTLENVTYNTLKEWMEWGWTEYEDVLQTTWPDLTRFEQAGGKVLHYHGESDPSIPPGSSVHYHESVRKMMYPGLSFNASTEALGEFYRLFLVPGAAHCAPSSYQPGPFPQTTLATLIDWVENKQAPDTLNATVLSGATKGEEYSLCRWPLRPLWANNGSTMNCVYDEASLKTWQYDFDAYKLPLY